ncbi:ROK family protein [Caldilinea sp.]|jgi:glucokinase|uniref:ROK family protein n=1 Tax=Caldilinea sp. TaxID=2293560 RepID=UPI002603DA38|nr:ROK family protein [uncultured Caldilinea sp.]
MSWDEVAIGLDVGGTKIAAGLIDRHGKVLMRRTVPTDAAQGGMAVLEKSLGLAQALRASAEAEGYKVAGVGVSVCELVDLQGVVTSEYTLQWRKIPVQTIFSELVAPAVVVADVRAHAFAEARFGAGRKLASFVFVNVGTGISSCFVLEGRPYAGARGNALVLATMPLVVFDEQERKFEFALEAFASGLGLIERYRRHKAGVARVEEIVADAAQGNKVADSILRSGGEALGGAVAWLVNVLDPEAVIVGGGLGLADGLYWESLVAAARTHIFADASRTLPILHAACGADAGVIGAGASIFAG